MYVIISVSVSIDWFPHIRGLEKYHPFCYETKEKLAHSKASPSMPLDAAMAAANTWHHSDHTFLDSFSTMPYTHRNIRLYVQGQKIVCVIRSRFFSNVKWGAHLWDQLFPVHFLVRNVEKIVPHQNKNRVFGKSSKTGFSVLKYNFFFVKNWENIDILLTR